MGAKLRYEINISGNVQGVGFRWNAANEARKLGIAGFVRNLPDGSVYIEAEGSKGQLEEYVRWCKKGPIFGFVDSVEVTSSTPQGFCDFTIQH